MTPGSNQTRRRLFAVWSLWVWLAWLFSGELTRAGGLAAMAVSILRPPWPAAGEAAAAALFAVLGATMVCLGALGAGRPGLIWLKRPPDRLLALAAGFPALALTTQALGWLGLLLPGVIVPATLAAAAAGVMTMQRSRAPRPTGYGTNGVPDLAVMLPVGFAVALVLIAACAPEVAWDAMVYHLRVPSLYLLAHKIYPIPEIFPSFFPFSGETLFVLARGFGGDPAARCLHALAWLCCGAAVARLADRIWGRTESAWAAAIFLTVPLGMVIASRAYVEYFMVLPLLAALIVLAETPGRPSRPAAALIGWLTGAAFGTKYLGGFGALLVCGLCWKRARFGTRTATLVMAAAAAAGGTWLLRNWLWTGNPVFPVLFGGPRWTAADMAGWREDAQALQADLSSALTAPWSLLAAPGGDGALTPLLLIAVAVPLCWPGARRGPYWALVLALFVVWRVTSPLPRYLALGIAVASVAGAGTFAGWELGTAGRRWARRLSLLGLWGSAVCGVSAIAFSTNSYALALGKIPRDAYRAGYFRPEGYTTLLHRLEARVPPHGRVYLLGHLFSYDLPRRVWFEFLYVRPPLYWWLAEAPSPVRIRIKARQAGLTHVAWLPIGAQAIFGAHPELMNWTPAKLAVWRKFWRMWMRETDRVGGWTIFELTGRPGQFPLPQSGTPGTEGLRAAPRPNAAGGGEAQHVPTAGR